MPAERLLLDVNVLIALAWPQHVHHARAHRWFDGLAAPWATTPITESGFLRVSLDAVAVDGRVAAADAIAALSAIRESEGHFFLPDGSSLALPAVNLRRIASHRQITDVHLVNLAATADVMLATLDRGIPDLLEPDDRRHVLLLPA